MGKMGCTYTPVSLPHPTYPPHLDKHVWELEQETRTLGDLGGHWRAVSVAAPMNLIFSVHVRFDILDQEMKTLKTQIDDVNLAANSLMESGHPRSGEVKQYQDNLNSRWAEPGAWELVRPSPSTCHPPPRVPCVPPTSLSLSATGPCRSKEGGCQCAVSSPGFVGWWGQGVHMYVCGYNAARRSSCHAYPDLLG